MAGCGAGQFWFQRFNAKDIRMIIPDNALDTDPGTAPPLAAAKLAVLAGGNVMMTMMISSVLPASGAIAQHFSAIGNADLRAQFILLCPYISFIFAAPLSGIAIQRFGRRWPLLAMFALYVLAGGAELFINGFWLLAAARVALGVAGGSITTIVMTLAGDYFTGKKRIWAVTLVGLAPAVGAVTVILISGILVDIGGWHMAFLPYLISVPILLLAFFVVDEPERPAQTQANAGTLSKSFWGLCLITMGVSCFAVTPAVQLPFVMFAIGIHNATPSSIVLTISTAIAVTAATFYPVLRRLFSVNTILVLILGCGVFCFALLCVAKSIVIVCIALMIGGPPSGLMITHFSAVTIERVSPEARGRALGLINSSISLGQLLIPFVTQPLRVTLGIQPMFGVLSVVLFVAGVIALIAPRMKRVTYATN
jgi:MFS family permease